jgi:RES domain-containing protein
MLVYRLAKEKYIRDLSGTGARLYGGRWNRKGTPLLYSSEHTSLAILELLVHTPHTLLPTNISLLTLFIPDELEIRTLEIENLAANWQQYPAPDSLAEMGTHWIKSQESVAIKVPSVVVPNEWNILLNPDHPEFKKIDIKSVSPFQLDSRF